MTLGLACMSRLVSMHGYACSEYRDANCDIFKIMNAAPQSKPQCLSNSMPPRKRVSAPTARVYKSSVPLTQIRFQDHPKRINSYGKNTSRRVPKPDNTLTQMDFVKLNMSMDEEDDEFSVAEPIEPKRQRRRVIVDLEDEDNDVYVREEEKRKKKRRRTTSAKEDEPKSGVSNRRRRNTVGEIPTTTSSYHTQTLTQMEHFSSMSSLAADEEEEAQEHDGSIFDILKSSQILRPRRKSSLKAPRQAKPPIIPTPQQQALELMPPPQTPHRKMKLEIPSSQSPMTPFSNNSIRSSPRRRIQLSERDKNASIPFSITPKRRKLVVQDTFGSEGSQQGHVLSSPPKQSSPAKSVRFADPENEQPITASAIKREPVHTQLLSSQHPSTQYKLEDEILDSDAESDVSYNEMKSEPDQLSEGGSVEEQQPETCYGEIGLETQIEAEVLLNPRGSSEPTKESQKFGGLETARSQFMESQRISKKQADSMAPRTNNSDIFISIHPPYVKEIINRTKSHEFRSWALPPTVVRLWIYETAPRSTIRYMAAISPAKCPGDILDENGLGNAEFNRKPAGSEYAYEIIDLYELANPRNLAELKEMGWLKGPPQKMAWVRPAVLDDLMGNLKPPIFTRQPLQLVQDPQSSPFTDTQEVEAQLLGTVQQSTQPPTPEKIPSTPVVEREEYSSEDLPVLPALNQQQQETTPCRIPPSQAETVDLSQAGTSTPRNQSLVDVVWESPTRPVPSSTPQLPLPLFTKPSTSLYSDPTVPFSMVSSQLLTKSQMLPDSLLNESVPAPPGFVQDSDEDEDEIDE